MYALIEKTTNKIIRTASVGAELQEAKPFFWTLCPDDCSAKWSFDGESFSPPPGPTLEQVKEARRSEINSERNARETLGFEFMGKLFDSDQRSADRIQIAALAAQSSLMASQPFEVEWTAADNSSVTLDALGMLGLAGAFAAYGASLHATAKAMKAAVDAASTAEEVEAVLWPA